MSEHDVENEGPERTSRRDLLKKAAIVGGAAWTAPLIMSVTAKAYAGSSAPACQYFCDEPPGPCTCRVSGQDVPGDFLCGGCLINKVQVADCSQCGPGNVCVLELCDGADTYWCYEPCPQ